MQILICLIELLGPLALGLVVGYFVQYFIKRFGVFDAKSLVSVTSALGSGIIGIVLQTNESWMFWSYCIGLFGGALVIPTGLCLFNKYVRIKHKFGHKGIRE